MDDRVRCDKGHLVCDFLYDMPLPWRYLGQRSGTD